MSTFLQSIDTALFFFVNHTLSNPPFDFLMPFLTDLNKIKIVQILAVAGWLAAVIRGGRRARTVCILLVVAVACSDQISSTVIKSIVGRLRPCFVLEDVRTLVDCGSGYSFPSSHAVNNFAAATILSYYYRRYVWGFVLFAAVIAFSRMYVGVHYPSDVLGGAIIGTAVSSLILYLWFTIEKHFHLATAQPFR
jgi:undecaprenyl-diphosphatase